MDSDSGAPQPEATLDPVPAPDGGTSITNEGPSKRDKTDEDAATSSSNAQPLDNGNESLQVHSAVQSGDVMEAIEPPNSNTGAPSRIRVSYGFPNITLAEMQGLREWLASHANATTNNQVANGIHTQLLKSMEPNQQDLEAICRTVGVDTNGIDWKTGIHIPGVMEQGLKARPHQIAGATWISTTLESPLRAALLADECGTGKTVQIGIALAIHYHHMKAEVEAGTFKPRDEKRWFKPSVLFCLPDLAYQTFREWSHWFPDFFNIQICHGTKAQAADEFIERHIMDEEDGLQSWVDENAASHKSIETLRNIAIVPYHTAVRRMISHEKNQAASLAPAQLRRGLKRKRNKKDEKEELKFAIEGQSYNWVICDDVYAIRGPRTKTHQLITQLEHEATLWPFVYGPGYHRFRARLYYSKKAWPALQDGGQYRRLTMDHIIQPRHSIGPLNSRDQIMRDEYTTYIREKKGPLFLMNPDLFQKFCEEMKPQKPGVAREAIRPLLEMFCLRRGMLTPATMPDGTIVVPSEGIPPMYIRTVKLQSHNDEDKNDLYKIIKKHYPFLFHDSWDVDQDIGHGTIDKAKPMWPNPTIVRTLALSTTNIEFYPLTQKPDGANGDKRQTPLNSKLGQKVMDNRPCLDRLKSFSLSGANTGTIDTDVPNEIQKILRKDGVGGLLWYLSVMQENQHVEFPETREDILKTFCPRSPKLCWTINRVLELKEQGHRVLVFVDNPLTSLILMALLTSLCVNALNIRSSNDVDQCAHMVRQFNDPESQVDALVVSFQLDGFGMNLQGACHYGIVVEYPKNLPTMLHGFGRLWRMGQEYEVHWDVLYLENSFDGWVETWMASKYADILAAEGEIPDEIKGEYRVICGFELIKRYLGQDSNRYPRTRVTWAEQEHPLVARESHFYSAVANYLMQNPGHYERFLQPLSDIARRWSPDQDELTLDMIEGRSLLLEDGVILDSRNPLTPGYIAVSAGDDLHQELRQAVEIRSNLRDDDSRLRMERERRV
ncbi:hypothetical protein FOQG_05870 [Fusarium oxysporum f. sp. raphani 54005]|uniref:Helicase C-terminal domain-containing protein n=2 Tax=Fusarium oxysporum f. sp. raphani TaxID=96318 RepID=X0CKM7_FUSOX|nr:hypothetical protein FOQG_05870 [Fusarium oxysporum f. sp. raphani 54005]